MKKRGTSDQQHNDEGERKRDGIWELVARYWIRLEMRWGQKKKKKVNHVVEGFNIRDEMKYRNRKRRWYEKEMARPQEKKRYQKDQRGESKPRDQHKRCKMRGMKKGVT